MRKLRSSWEFTILTVNQITHNDISPCNRGQCSGKWYSSLWQISHFHVDFFFFGGSWLLGGIWGSAGRFWLLEEVAWAPNTSTLSWPCTSLGVAVVVVDIGSGSFIFTFWLFVFWEGFNLNLGCPEVRWSWPRFLSVASIAAIARF